MKVQEKAIRSVTLMTKRIAFLHVIIDCKLEQKMKQTAE